MRRLVTVLVTGACLALAACNPSEGEDGSATARKDSIDSNLKCAALISAANALVVSGKAERDPTLAKQALVSSMTYLNSYAIPKGLKQAEAFREVKSLRAELIGSLPPAEIMSRAKRCVNRTPSSR